MLLQELMGDFLQDEVPQGPDFLPPAAVNVIADSQFENWEKVESPTRLIKDFSTTCRESLFRFISGLLQFEDAFGHHAKITIDYLNVRVEVYTHDVNDITELDVEYAQYADSLWVDTAL